MSIEKNAHALMITYTWWCSLETGTNHNHFRVWLSGDSVSRMTDSISDISLQQLNAEACWPPDASDIPEGYQSVNLAVDPDSAREYPFHSLHA